MSATTLGSAQARHIARGHSLRRQRRWALWGSYAALTVFVVVFLAPPFYTVMTSLKSSAEISSESGNPWYAHHPTLANFWYLITYPNFQTYYLNSVIVTVLTVSISMVISVLAAFSLPGAAVAAVSSVVPDHRLARADQQLLVPGAAVSDAGCAVLYLDHDRLFQLHPEGAG
jgi:ABC-type polysaccharide transport system permease subunit